MAYKTEFYKSESRGSKPASTLPPNPGPRMAFTKRLPEAFALLVFLAAFFYIPARGLELRSLHAATPLAPSALDSSTPLDASDEARGPPQEYGAIPDDPKAPPPRPPKPEGEAEPARPTPAHMGKDHLVMKGYNAGNPTPEMKAAEKKVNDEIAEDVKARAEERADNDGVVTKASGKKCDPEADAAKAKAKAKAEGEAAANKAAPLPDAAKVKAAGERGQRSEREEELTHAKGHPVKGEAEAADTAAKVAPGGAAATASGSEGEAKGAKGGSKESLASAITSAGSEAEARR